MTEPYTDVGNAIVASSIGFILDAFDQYKLRRPEWVGQIGGTSIPTDDACDGMLWGRVASMYPTDGSGQQFTTARWDSAFPCWSVMVEFGFLWCHEVIEEDGSGPGPSVWSDNAHRDGQYRSALLFGLRAQRDEMCSPLKDVVSGQIIQPWSPVGPDGGVSGGLTVVNFICLSEAVCG